MYFFYQHSASQILRLGLTINLSTQVCRQIFDGEILWYHHFINGATKDVLYRFEHSIIDQASLI